MTDRYELHCPYDGRFLGSVPFKPLWTGAVVKVPVFDRLENRFTDDDDLYPEDMRQNYYLPCEACRKAKRAQWMRYEEVPENPILQIVVPVIAPELPPDPIVKIVVRVTNEEEAA